MPRHVRKRLTDRMISSTKPEAGKDEIWLMDSEVSGLGVRIRSTGSKDFYIRYLDQYARSRKLRIGDAKSVTVEAARKVAKQKVAQIADGLDPHEVKRAKRGLITVSELAEEVLEVLEEGKKSESYIKDCRRLQAVYVKKPIGSMAVKEVTVADCERVLRGARGKPSERIHLKRWLTRCFNYAVRQAWAVSNPASSLEVSTLPPRQTYLNDDQLKTLLEALNTSEDQEAADFVRLCLLTGARPRAMRLAERRHFDLQRKTWLRPAQITKNKRTDEVLLSEAAATLVKRQLQRHNSDFLFPSPADPLQPRANPFRRFWDDLRETLGWKKNIILYDLRKTFATRLMGAGVDLATVMKATGHTQASVLLRHYAHAIPSNQGQAVEAFANALPSPPKKAETPSV